MSKTRHGAKAREMEKRITSLVAKRPSFDKLLGIYLGEVGLTREGLVKRCGIKEDLHTPWTMVLNGALDRYFDGQRVPFVQINQICGAIASASKEAGTEHGSVLDMIMNSLFSAAGYSISKEFAIHRLEYEKALSKYGGPEAFLRVGWTPGIQLDDRLIMPYLLSNLGKFDGEHGKLTYDVVRLVEFNVDWRKGDNLEELFENLHSGKIDMVAPIQAFPKYGFQGIALSNLILSPSHEEKESYEEEIPYAFAFRSEEELLRSAVNCSLSLLAQKK